MADPKPLPGQSLPGRADETPIQEETATTWWKSLGSKPGKTTPEVMKGLREKAAHAAAPKPKPEEPPLYDYSRVNNFLGEMSRGAAEGFVAPRVPAMDSLATLNMMEPDQIEEYEREYSREYGAYDPDPDFPKVPGTWALVEETDDEYVFKTIDGKLISKEKGTGVEVELDEEDVGDTGDFGDTGL